MNEIDSGIVGTMNRSQRRRQQKLARKKKPSDKIGKLFSAAAMAHKGGDLQAARDGYQKVLGLNPRHSRACNNLALLELHENRPEQGLQLCMVAVEEDDQYVAGWNTLGLCHKATNNPEQAKLAYRKAIAKDPSYSPAYNNLGHLLVEEGQPEKALDVLQESIRLDPSDSNSWNNLGIAFQQLDRTDEASSAWLRCVQIRPLHEEAYWNLLNADTEDQVLKQAHTILETNRKDFTDQSSYLSLQGRFHLRARKIAEAETFFRAALQNRPDPGAAKGLLDAVTLQQDAVRAAQTAEKLLSQFPENEDLWMGYLFSCNYHPDLTLGELYQKYATYSQIITPEGGVPARPSRRSKSDNRLRIGYVSADFRNHSAMRFIEPVLENHDHSRVHITAYSTTLTTDEMTSRCQEAIDCWRDVRGMPDRNVAALIRQDEVDVLVDLSGHTAGNRLAVFALRPAPVQVTWMGYGYTTGLRAIDWFLADEEFVPKGFEEYFSESIWRLPCSPFPYQPPADTPHPCGLPALQTGYVTYGCLSRAVRINYRVARCWSALLNQTPGSRLLLNSGSYEVPSVRNRIRNLFETNGLDPTRIDFFSTRGREGVSASYRSMDIALDPFPHNAGTTTYEALSQGVPVFSMRDRPSTGRFGATILHAMNLDDWLADNESDYVARCAAHAKNTEYLSTLRNELPLRMRECTIGNHQQFVRHLEDAYERMVGQIQGHRK